MQVVSLTTQYISMGAGHGTLPPIRHLHLETNIDYLLEHSDLQAFTQMETLSLRPWKSEPSFINTLELDISSAQNLGRLRIENWSPKSIRVTQGCRVYAVWQPPATPTVAPNMQAWLHSPCWRAPGTKLAALHIEHHCLLWCGLIQLSAIRAILKRQHELETLKIAVERLGSPEMPLNILFPDFNCMKTPLRVDIRTQAGCFLNPSDTLCLSETLGLDIKGPVLVPVQAASGKSCVRDGCFANGGQMALGPPFLQASWPRTRALMEQIRARSS